MQIAVLLGRVHPFTELTEDALQTLANCAELQRFEAGAQIIYAGKRGDSLYVIASGGVQVQTPGDTPRHIAWLAEGELFGEMAIIDGSKRVASAIALEDCEFSLVSKEQLNERINDSDPIVRLLISMFLHRIRNSLKNNKSDLQDRTNIFSIKSLQQKHV